METARVSYEEEAREDEDQVIESFRAHYKRDPTGSVLELIGGMLIVQE